MRSPCGRLGRTRGSATASASVTSGGACVEHGGRAAEEQVLDKEVLADEIGRTAGTVEHADVEPAADQPLAHVAAERLADMQPDAGKFAPDAMKQRLDKDHADGGRHADAYGAGRRSRARFQARIESIDLLQQRAPVFENETARLAEFGAASVAPQQGRAAFRLQLANVTAQRRLRDAKMPRGEREAAELADTDKVSQPL